MYVLSNERPLLVFEKKCNGNAGDKKTFTLICG